MGFADIKRSAHNLFSEASYIYDISNSGDHEIALALMDDLIEDYDNNLALIVILSRSIEDWENKSEEFADFNAQVANLGDVDVLRLLMDQHGLGVSDFPEIGSKSLMSKILNGRNRNLTKDHIDLLSKRFSVSPAVFFKA